MVNVLFVCLGNICRSPMAEGVFRHLVKDAGLQHAIRVDSAGTGAWHVGEPPHHGTRRVLEGRGIDTAGLVARQVAPADLEEFAYIVAMDRENLGNLERLRSGPAGRKVHLLSDFMENPKVRDVPDPWYTGNFELVYEMVDEGCRGLLAQIRRECRL